MRRPNGVWLWLLGAGLLCLVIWQAGEARASTLIIDANGEGDHTTIQAAIDNASLGDTLQVWNGTYTEALVVNQSVSLIGNGSGAVRLEAPAGAPATVTITADNVDLTGFNLTGSGSFDFGVRAERVHRLYLSHLVVAAAAGDGIWLDEVSDCTLNDTVLVDNTNGVSFRNSKDCVVKDSFLWKNHEMGVYVLSSEHITLEDNLMPDNVRAVTSRESRDVSILNNEMDSKITDIKLISSTNHTIKKNFMSSGFEIEGDRPVYWDSHNMGFSNQIDGKGLFYVTRWDGANLPAGAGQIIIANATNITIEDLSVNHFPGHESAFVTIAFSSHVLVQHNTFSNMARAIHFYQVHNSTIYNNHLELNEEAILNQRSRDISILSNRLTSSEGAYGIVELSGIDDLLAGNLLAGNHSQTGIYVTVDWESPRRSALNTKVYDNRVSGFVAGIMLEGTEASQLRANTLSQCRHCVDISYSGNLTMTHNLVQNSSSTGVMLEETWGVQIHLNRFRCDCEYALASEDDLWHNATYNWWGNLSGPYNASRNPDGERPEVAGKVTFTPWYTRPLLDRAQASRAIYTEEQTVGLQATARSISSDIRYSWTSDLDGELYNGSQSEQEIPGLSNGTHNLTLRVQDELGFWSQPARTQVTVQGLPRALRPVPEAPVVFRGERLALTFQGFDHEDALNELTPWLSYQPPDENISADWLSTPVFNLTGQRWEVFFSPPLNASLGNYDVNLRFTDSDGLNSTLKTLVRAFKVVNGLPTAYIVEVSPNPVLQTSFFTMTGRGTDPESDIASYFWRTEDQTLYQGPLDKVSFPGLVVGPHTLYFSVIDRDGGWSPEVSIPLLVGSRPVMEAAVWPGEELFPSTQVTFYANQTQGRPVVLYRWVSELSGELYNGSQPSFNTSLRPGLHYVYLQARDDQGFWSKEVYLTLEVQAPSKCKGCDDRDPLTLAMVLGLGLIAVVILLALWDRARKAPPGR